MIDDAKLDRILKWLPVTPFRVQQLNGYLWDVPGMSEDLAEFIDGNIINARRFAGYLRRNADRMVGGRAVRMHTRDETGSWWVVSSAEHVAESTHRKKASSMSCETCSFLDGLTQTCRRMPPQINAEGFAAWPKVPLWEWCGEGDFLDVPDGGKSAAIGGTDDPWAPIIQEWIKSHTSVTAHDIARRAIALPAAEVTQSAQRRIVTILRSLGWVPNKRSGKNGAFSFVQADPFDRTESHKAADSNDVF